MHTISLWLAACLLFTFPTEDMLLVSDGLGSVSRVVGIAVTLFWIMTVCIKGQIRKFQPVHFALGVFILWNGLSVFWSVDVERTVPRIMTYIQLLVLFCLLWDVCRTPAALRVALQAYVCGTYVAIASQLSNFAHGTAGLEFSRYRFTPTGIHPNSIGLILALTIPIAWYLAISSSGTGKMARLMRFLNYAYVPAAFFCIVLTASRGSVLASVPAVIYILRTVLGRDSRNNFLVATGIILVLCSLIPLVPENLIERLSTTGEQIREGDLNGRVAIWKEGIQSFFARPFFGAGASAFPAVNSIGGAAHNSFLSVLIDLGLVGLVIFLAALWVIFCQVMRIPQPERWFWLALLAVWLVGQMGHNWEHTKHTWLIFSVVAIAGDRWRRLPTPAPFR